MKKEKNLHVDESRREFFQVAAKVAICMPWLWSIPVSADLDEAKKAIKDLANGKPLSKGLVKVTVPQVADNGARVMVEVTVDSPMTESDHVKEIHIISDGNPFPETVSFTLGPDVGKAEVKFYSRMAKTQNTYAVARMSDGSIQMGKGKSSVTIGGC